jgi:hypothetical protein
MNLLERILSILSPPRLPRLGREEMANCAEYHNRLNRHREADLHPAGFWAGRIAVGRDSKLSAVKPAEEAQPATRRRARLAGSILEAAERASQ